MGVRQREAAELAACPTMICICKWREAERGFRRDQSRACREGVPLAVFLGLFFVWGIVVFRASNILVFAALDVCVR